MFVDFFRPLLLHCKRVPAPGECRVLIAQITDTHVSEPGRLFGGRVDTRAALERCIAHILKLDPAPDVALVSGDVAETGTRVAYEFAAAQLARLPFPVLAIPGNHDVREAMAETMPRYTAQIAGGHLCIASDGFALRLIGLDTVVPGASEGELCESRLAWLEGELQREPRKPALIFMHHPPFRTGMSIMDRIGVNRGREEFAAILKKHPQIAGVICGHAHRTIATAVSGVPVRLAPSAAYPFALDLRQRGELHFVQEPPQIALHLWDAENGLTSHASFIENFPGPFPLT